MLTRLRYRFVTIIRFDVRFPPHTQSSIIPTPYPHHANQKAQLTITPTQPVYVQHFKCNIRDIRSGYPALHRWMRHLYWKVPAFGETTNFPHIKFHYTKSHTQINPLSITPVGPLPDILGFDDEVRAAKAAAAGKR